MKRSVQMAGRLQSGLLGQESDETHVLARIDSQQADSHQSDEREFAIRKKIFRQHMASASTGAQPRETQGSIHLEGMAKYSMPKFVGGGKDVAMPWRLAKAGFAICRRNE